MWHATWWRLIVAHQLSISTSLYWPFPFPQANWKFKSWKIKNIKDKVIKYQLDPGKWVVKFKQRNFLFAKLFRGWKEKQSHCVIFVFARSIFHLIQIPPVLNKKNTKTNEVFRKTKRREIQIDFSSGYLNLYWVYQKLWGKVLISILAILKFIFEFEF